MTARLTVALAFAAALLAGCSDGGDDDGDDFQERLDAAGALNERVAALDPSAGAALPDAGSVRFEGIMAVNGDTQPSDASPTTALIGDATIVADFGNASLTGGATDFFGTVEGGTTRDYDGDLTLSDGLIGAGAANAAQARVTGTLTGGGRTVGVNSVLGGTFLGNPNVRGLEMLTASGSSTVTVDGVVVPSVVAVAAERR